MTCNDFPDTLPFFSILLLLCFLSFCLCLSLLLSFCASLCLYLCLFICCCLCLHSLYLSQSVIASFCLCPFLSFFALSFGLTLFFLHRFPPLPLSLSVSLFVSCLSFCQNASLSTFFICFPPTLFPALLAPSPLLRLTANKVMETEASGRELYIDSMPNVLYSLLTVLAPGHLFLQMSEDREQWKMGFSYHGSVSRITKSRSKPWIYEKMFRDREVPVM